MIAFNNSENNEEKVFIGIYDFSYAPYALGDAITWQVNLCVKAIENGCAKIAQYIIADPLRPSSYLQRYITENNYIEYLNNLSPVFLCCPNTVSIHFVKDKALFDLFMLKQAFRSQPSWPNIIGHLTGQLDFISHKSINKFYQKYKYVPRLTIPRGYENSMDAFLEKRCSNRFVVTVNIRQRRLYTTSDEASSAISRDAPLDEWYKFFRIVRDKHPEVVFLILGGYSTWERELYNYENVIIPRTMGFGLAHELTLLHKSDLFLGTSSGFSAMATFSETPYIITNFEPFASKFVGLPVGTPKYPFALDNQILSWEKESAELLLNLFETTYKSIRK